MRLKFEKFIYYILIILILGAFFVTACADEGSDDSGGLGSSGDGPDCYPPYVDIFNNTGYTLQQVLMHETPEYLSSENVVPTESVIGENIVNETFLNRIHFTESTGRYFTFIRNVTSESNIPIAVTTKAPIEFKTCYSHDLILVETDFLFYSEYDNYTWNSK